VLGVLHGLVILPVLLTIFSCNEEEEKSVPSTIDPNLIYMQQKPIIEPIQLPLKPHEIIRFSSMGSVFDENTTQFCGYRQDPTLSRIPPPRYSMWNSVETPSSMEYFVPTQFITRPVYGMKH
jgi:hypothetical protein